MGKTVCKVHEIAHEEGQKCSYCEGLLEDLKDTIPIRAELSADQFATSLCEDDLAECDEEDIGLQYYNFSWI